MFRGITPINLDAKGRFGMPSRYRETIEELCQSQMVVTIETHSPCLLVYPRPEWLEIEKQLRELPSYDKRARRIRRQLIGHAQDVEVDSAGRLLLSQTLREYAGLEKKMMLVGQGHFFEVWSDSNWAEEMDACQEDSDDLSELSESIMKLRL